MAPFRGDTTGGFVQSSRAPDHIPAFVMPHTLNPTSPCMRYMHSAVFLDDKYPQHGPKYEATSNSDVMLKDMSRDGFVCCLYRTLPRMDACWRVLKHWWTKSKSQSRVDLHSHSKLTCSLTNCSAWLRFRV